MADLLVLAKVELIALAEREDLPVEDVLTPRAFQVAWTAAWEVMVEERAWPHATEHRRQWRAAMIACKGEMRAAFLGRPTTFARIAEALTAAGERMEVDVTVEDLPRAFLGAIAAYGATNESEAPAEAREAMQA